MLTRRGHDKDRNPFLLKTIVRYPFLSCFFSVDLLLLLINSQAWSILKKMVACSNLIFKGKSWGEVTSDGLPWRIKDSEWGTIFEWLNTRGVLSPDAHSHIASKLTNPARGDWWTSSWGSSLLFAYAASPYLNTSGSISSQPCYQQWGHWVHGVRRFLRGSVEENSWFLNGSGTGNLQWVMCQEGQYILGSQTSPEVHSQHTQVVHGTFADSL